MHPQPLRFSWWRLRVLLALVVSLGACSWSYAVARLGPINANGSAGATLDIPVGFTSSEEITCLQFDVLFDAARVSLGTARTGTAAPGHRIESRQLGSGRQRVVIYSTTLAPLNGGYVVQLPVTWSAAGDSALAVEAVYLADTEGTAVAFTSSTLAPAITANGSGDAATAGVANTIQVEPTSGPGVTYEWRFNGQLIPGATGATLSLPNTQRFHAGTYSVVVSANGLTLNSQSFALTVNPPAPNDARLLNLSTRGLAQSGDNVLIPGFVVQGGTNKKLLIRAVGPTLVDLGFGLTVIPDPTMSLKRRNESSGQFETFNANDDWQTNANAAEIISKSADLFAFALSQPKDAALLVDLPPGEYTVVAGDKTGTSGIAIVELYDADAGTPDSRLINISNRGFCGTGDQVMIPGFVVSSEGPKTLLVRVVGPTLGSFGVGGTMADPKLTIYSGHTPILENDNWSAGPDAAVTAQIAQEVHAFALNDGSTDAAFVVTLPPGVYTVVGSSATADGTGVVLVEVYVVP